MAGLSFRPQARTDLEDIFDHISADNPPAAEAVIRGILDHVDMLVDRPNLGRSINLQGLSLKLFTSGRYQIFYQYDGSDGVEIVRVIHGARDWARILTADPS